MLDSGARNWVLVESRVERRGILWSGRENARARKVVARRRNFQTRILWTLSLPLTTTNQLPHHEPVHNASVFNPREELDWDTSKTWKARKDGLDGFDGVGPGRTDSFGCGFRETLFSIAQKWIGSTTSIFRNHLFYNFWIMCSREWRRHWWGWVTY